MPRKKSNKNIPLKPIKEVAASAGIKNKFLELYGTYKAKVSLQALRPSKKKGKYIAVTSITPTPFGEGKTVTTIGLSMALNKLKKKTIACIPQPSLAGTLGAKGNGMGGGLARVLTGEESDFCLTGDICAVGAAHNLCAAYLDNMLFRGNPLGIEQDSINWRRVVDINDRSLRNVNIGLGSKTDSVPRKSGFDITASSELMSILELAKDTKDMRERIGKIVLGFTKKGKAITCGDLKIAGAMTALLKNALKPNLLQTGEHTPCFVHGGSYGNIALGGTSVIADSTALSFSDFTVTETGFSAETGAEKFFDIKCRASGLKPDAAVIVCTTRALKIHSGDYDATTSRIPREIYRENVSAVERGIANLEKHMENLATFGVPVVVCVNRFAEDSEKEITAIKKRVLNRGISSVAVSNVWTEGSSGGLELAESVIAACKTKTSFRFLYPVDIPVKDKIKRIAKTLYGAKEIVFSEEVDKTASSLRKSKLDMLPICIAKTHLSLSSSPKRKGRPHGFKFPVDSLTLASGAGFLTAFSNNIRTMPGMAKSPNAVKIDINGDGKITGLSS